MSGSGDDFKEESRLVNEIVKLKLLESENKMFSALLTHYKAQLSDKELEISDLKAQIMAKDFEIKSLTVRSKSKKLSEATQSNLLTQPCYKTEQTECEHEEIFRFTQEIYKLKLLLEQEKEKSESYRKDIENLQRSLKNPINDQKLEKAFKKLQEENEELKARLAGEEHSTAHKSFYTNDFKSPSIYIDTENNSVAESTPRMEPSIPDIQMSNTLNHSFPSEELLSALQDPKPPKTRCKSDYPKRTLNFRSIKNIVCDLSEVISSPVSNQHLASFCPSSIRKLKLGYK